MGNGMQYCFRSLHFDFLPFASFQAGKINLGHILMLTLPKFEKEMGERENNIVTVYNFLNANLIFLCQTLDSISWILNTDSTDWYTEVSGSIVLNRNKPDLEVQDAVAHHTLQEDSVLIIVTPVRFHLSVFKSGRKV